MDLPQLRAVCLTQKSFCTQIRGQPVQNSGYNALAKQEAWRSVSAVSGNNLSVEMACHKAWEDNAVSNVQ